MIFRPPFFLPWIYPGLRWNFPSEEKIIYLTFDDGPVPGPTEFVVDTLLDAGATATFFCIGDNVRKHSDVFKTVLGAGHSIGNHTFNHIKGWNADDQTYIENVKKCENTLLEHGCPRTSFFRPPYGRIKRSQIRALQKEYSIIMWDVLTHDYAKSFSPERCLRGSLNNTRRGSVVVFHDSLKAERNMRYVLPRFLDHFGGLGFAFKALPIS